MILPGQAMLICVIQSVLHHSTIYAQDLFYNSNNLSYVSQSIYIDSVVILIIVLCPYSFLMFLTMVPSTLWADKLVFQQAIGQDSCFAQTCLFPLRYHKKITMWDMYIAIPWPIKFTRTANLLNFQIHLHNYLFPHVPQLCQIFSSSTSTTSSQRHHPSSCSKQKQINLGVLSFPNIQSPILSTICFLCIYTPNKSPNCNFTCHFPICFSMLLLLWLATTNQMTIS